jgi:hypothetical protein
MSTENPIDALQKQFELEDSSVSPVPKIVLSVASRLPLPRMLDKLIRGLREQYATDSSERVRLLLETVIGEVQRHEREIQELRDDAGSRGLLLDAARRAASTRSLERVHRIGLILSGALMASDRTNNDDDTEEMMRIATELSDSDIEFLRELVRIEGTMLQGRDHIPRYDAFERWTQGRWGDSIDPRVDSAFSKLESYGLVSRLAPPNNLTILADFQNRYVLLPKGLRFVDSIREASARLPNRTE